MKHKKHNKKVDFKMQLACPFCSEKMTFGGDDLIFCEETEYVDLNYELDLECPNCRMSVFVALN